MHFALASVALFAQGVFSTALPWASASEERRHEPFLHKRQDQNVTAVDYDFVVVGSGIGGGPTAANLAIAGFKVLLIDAGGDSGDALIEIVPALALSSVEFKEQQWDFYVNHHSDLAQQKRDTKMSYSLPDGSVYTGLNPPQGASPLGVLYPRAGTLGGCSRHNALITMQAFDADWDHIAEITADPTWKHDNMRSYLEKIENVDYFPFGDRHGFDGWLNTAVTSLFTAASDLKIVSILAGAAYAIGKGVSGPVLGTAEYLARVLFSDINAPGQLQIEQIYQVPLSMRDSKRGGARDVIIETANAVNSDGSRKYQLDILLNTLVTKVVFDESGDVPRATGVEYIQGKSLYRADPRHASGTVTGSGSISATKEIILAGGTYNTPQMLKLSGIGPREELESFGIPVKVELPGVGTNLQDRYEQTVIGETSSPFELTKNCKWTTTEDDPCFKQWKNGLTQTLKGPYASNGIAMAVTKKSSVAENDTPDLILLGGAANFTGYYPGWSKIVLDDSNHFSWIVLKARSRNVATGTVTLRSTDPRDTPIIDFRYFEKGGDADLQAMREGIDLARTFFDSVLPVDDIPVDELLDGGFDEIWPGRDVSSDAAIKQYVKDEAWGHHASGTNPIGADNDPLAVLDGDFRVRGVDSLRVVDASVFPRIPGFFVALPVHQIAEKASDVIIQQYTN